MATKKTKKKTTRKKKKTTTRKKAPAKKKTKKKRTRAEAGKTARTEGHRYERTIVNTWKARFEEREWADGVRRTDQSHRAYLPDVHGVPALWQELGKNSAANPEKKLEQAIGDVLRSPEYSDSCMPISVTRKRGGTDVVAMRLADLHRILHFIRVLEQRVPSKAVVQMPLADFMDLYDLAGLDAPSAVIPQQKEAA